MRGRLLVEPCRCCHGQARGAWFSRAHGFNLVELLAAISIAAIMAAIGVPSFRFVTVSNRMSSEVNLLLGDMQFARGEAIKRGLPVTACISTDGASCVTSGTNWSGGWILFVDTNSNATVDAGEPVIRVQKGFGNSDSFVADSNLRAVIFNREGFATSLAGTATIALHDSTNNTAYTRCLAVNRVGLLLTQRYNQTFGTQTCT